MSVDHAVSGPALHPGCRFLKSKSLRQLLASAIATCTLAQSTLLAQQAPGIVQTLQVQPAGMQAFQLESPSVSGQVDAIHSPNVDQMLKPQYHLEIERRHSQLVITNRKVRRIAVTDSTIANYVQYSETEISIVGMELGKTDLTFWFEGEAAPSIYEVSVVRDASLEEQRTVDFGKLERHLKRLFPNSTVALIPVGIQVLVRGQAYDGEEAQNILQIVRSEVMRTLGRASYNDDTGALNVFAASGTLGGAGGLGNGNNGINNGFRDIVINELSIPGEFNIKMRVLVAEINRSELRNAGIDWRVFFGDGRNVVGSTMGGAIGTTLSGIFENGEIAVFVRWLQSNGTIKLLAEPQIVCISGTAASILAGGEFAVPTIIGLGGGQATSFRGFGTSLVVTPTVMDRDLIRLQVVPEFSELNAANTVNGIPGTNVKRVMTTVELREGQTFAIGGLISRQTGTEVSRIPLLGDIPYIGPRIFQSKNASEVETELLVLVSPEIVRPMEPDEVPPVPGFNSTHPTDHELWHRGQTEGSPDNNVYQISPFGSGSMHGVPQGYSLYNPPVTHGGYTPPAQGGGAMMNHSGYPGGSSGSFGPEVQYPSGSTLPPATNYSSPPTQNYPPMQPMAVPPSQYVPPQQYGPPQQYAPQHQVTPQPMPSSQLPPAPQNYPSQGRFTPGQKPSMLSRMGAPFRKNDSTQNNNSNQNNAIKPAGWSRPVQK
jgi:pilus assembly protein CpaC